MTKKKALKILKGTDIYCDDGDKRCGHLHIIKFAPDLIEINYYKGRKLQGGVLVKKSKLLKLLK